MSNKMNGNQKIPKFKGIKAYEELIDEKIYNSVINERMDSNKKQFDNKKRLKTLEENINREKRQQNLVKEAINCSKRFNTRIVFDSNDVKQDINKEETNNNNSNESPLKGKQLFESDSEDNDCNELEMNLNKKLSDRNAEKLIELNSRFAHDVRFQIDERFFDSNNGEVNNEDNNEHNNEHNNEDNDNYETVLDEKQKNIHLLEEVLGTKVKPIFKRKETSNESNNKKKELFISRFDPTNKKSSIYEVLSSAKKKVSFDEQLLDNKTKPIEKESNVSQEVYYEVSSALKDSIDNKEEEFSFTQMFGNQTNVTKSNLNELNLKEDKIIQIKSNKNSLPNPFRYDSSSSDEEEEDNKSKAILQNNSINRKANSIQKFFFSQNDNRFDEDLFYSKHLVQKAKNDWKERQLMFIKGMALRKRSAKKNIKSDKKKIFKSKNAVYKRYKS